MAMLFVLFYHGLELGLLLVAWKLIGKVARGWAFVKGIACSIGGV